MKPRFSPILALMVGLSAGLVAGRTAFRRPLDASKDQPRARFDPHPSQTAPRAGRAMAPTPSEPGPAQVTLDQLDAAIRSALAPGERGRREELLRRLAESIDGADIPAALKLLAHRREPEARHHLARGLWARWARLDSGAALASAQGLPPSSARCLALDAIVEGWTQKAPDAAAKWVSQLPAGPRQGRQFAGQMPKL